MRALSSDLIDEVFGSRSLLVVGAGSSSPAAPLASQMKAGILKGICQIAGRAFNEAHIPNESFFTLELVCSLLKARFDENIDLHKFLSAALEAAELPLSSRVIAELISQNRVRCVFTANFDNYLYRALDERSVKYRIITRAAFDRAPSLEPERGDIFAFHGTVPVPGRSDLSLPTSIEARGLATPFTKKMLEYLQSAVLDSDTIVFWGYSGSDHFDMNPALEDCLRRKTASTRIVWLSYDGTERGFSDYVLAAGTNFGLRSPMAETVDGSQQIPEIIAQGLIMLDPTSAARMAPRSATTIDTTPVVDRVAACLRSAMVGKPKEGAASDLYDDIFVSKIWVPWVLIEHYYLDSLSNTEPAQSAFLGTGGRRLTFLGVGITGLSEAVLEYWKINRSWEPVLADGIRIDVADVSGEMERLIGASKFQAVFRALIEASYQIDEALSARPPDRNIDHALLAVCRALTENYLGLIKLRILEFTVAGNHVDNAAEQRLREEVQDCFKSAMIYAERAAGLESWSEISSPIRRSLTSAKLWHRVALFNLGRSTKGLAGIAIMRSSVDALLKVGRGEGDDYERGACYLQAAHQASIVFKALCGIKGNSDAPPPEHEAFAEFLAADPSASIARLKDSKIDALNDCIEAETEFRRLTGRFDSRLLAVADARVIDCLIRGDREQAQEIALNYQAEYSQLVDPQYPQWMPNIILRARQPVPGAAGASRSLPS